MLNEIKHILSLTSKIENKNIWFILRNLVIKIELLLRFIVKNLIKLKIFLLVLITVSACMGVLGLKLKKDCGPCASVHTCNVFFYYFL